MGARAEGEGGVASGEGWGWGGGWVRITLSNDISSHTHSHPPSHQIGNIFDGGSCATTQAHNLGYCSDQPLTQDPQVLIP